MKISVIIPAYNDAKYLETCLSAISDSTYRPYEVIVVDDASTDNTRDVVKKYGYKYTRLGRNSGQATARNVGAGIAKGEILFFVDSDIRIRKNTIGKIAVAYKNPDIRVYQGLTSKSPLNKGFGPELLALKWYHEAYKIRRPTYVYSHVFSIRKKVFFEIGGFNEKFKPPGGGEEFDLGHRLGKRYILHTDPSLLVEHGFQDIIPRAHTLYKRSYVWAGLFSKTKTFENVCANVNEVFVGVFDTLAILSLGLSAFHLYFFYLFILVFIAQTALNSGFYLFLLKTRGLFFLIKAIPANMLWSIVQIIGAIDFYMRRILGIEK